MKKLKQILENILWLKTIFLSEAVSFHHYCGRLDDVSDCVVLIIYKW